MRWKISAIGVGLAVSAAAQVPMSPIEQASVQQALNRGALMFAYDQAAWHGTDELQLKAADLLPSLGGWIVDGPAEAPEITFFSRDGAVRRALFIADLRDNKVIFSHRPTGGEQILSASRQHLVTALLAAREAVKVAGLGPCTPAPFNTIVLAPAKIGGPIAVYFMSAQTETQTIPFGGHYVVDVEPDGVASVPRAFTKSCLNMTPDPGPGAPAALVVTQLLTPAPTEIHVFSMLAERKPVYVGTSAGLWVVSAPGGQPQIRLLKRQESKNP